MFPLISHKLPNAYITPSKQTELCVAVLYAIWNNQYLIPCSRHYLTPLLFAFLKKYNIKKANHNSIKIAVSLWSEWRDLNSRPLDPQSSALPTAPHPDIKSCTCSLPDVGYYNTENQNVKIFFKIFGDFYLKGRRRFGKSTPSVKSACGTPHPPRKLGTFSSRRRRK